MGFFNEVLILLALILLLPVGERDRGVGLLNQRVPDVLFIAQNILDTANLPEGGMGIESIKIDKKMQNITIVLKDETIK